MFQLTKWRCVLLAALIAFAVAMPGRVTAESQQEQLYAKLKILSLVLNEIQEKYVESPEAEELVYGAIQGMVETLDPHSSFLTPEEMKDFQIETRGNFTGVGIEITMQDNILTVVSPIEDTPAYRAGVEAGDQIIKIDGKLTKNMTLMEAIKLIRGEKGTEVVLTMHREGEDKMIDIPIVRDVIPLRSIKYDTLEPGYGYLRISNFQGDTSAKLREAIKTLEEENQPLKGLILDLRNNPGGLLDQSIRVSDYFLSGGLVVSTKGKVEEQNMDFEADRETIIGEYPIVVLVNEGSASASEIVAGALQDQKRALILGSQTFGKGSVQTIIPLPDGSGLRLTTARYYTPSGRSIQATGITPDVLVKSPTKREIMREKDLENHLPGERKTKKKDQEAKVEGPADAKPEGPGVEPEGDDVEEKDEEEERPLRRWEDMTLEERLEADPQLREALSLLKQNEVWPLLRAAQNEQAP
jgi:carboxyl-terminal processing protease